MVGPSFLLYVLVLMCEGCWVLRCANDSYSLAIHTPRDAHMARNMGTANEKVNVKTISGVKGANAPAGYKEMPIFSPTMLISGGEENDS